MSEFIEYVFMVILTLGALAVAAIASFIAYHLYWVGRSRRPIEPGFEYVYVNQDGSVQELDEDDQSYLSQDFAPGDGGRPYIKSHYEAVDGWGSLSGFILRRQVPAELEISPVKQGCLPTLLTPDDLRQIHRQAGDVITENADGSFTASKKHELDPDQRFEQFKKIMLDRQAAAESGGGTLNQ